jgi:putative IMPACT (imprinted ancient) family translation regulator
VILLSKSVKRFISSIRAQRPLAGHSCVEVRFGG